MNRTEYIGKLNALYVGEKNCLEELITIYDEKDKEIERLKKINEEHRILNGELRKELQQKENIIKEVREYIEKAELGEDTEGDTVYLKDDLCGVELLEILDKGE